MKKQVLNIGLVATLGLTVAMFTSCQEENFQPEAVVNNIEKSNSVDKTTVIDDSNTIGVTIGNTTWATRNVDIPATFAQKSSDAGKFYQYTEEIDNPCPAGWRVPTIDEFAELLDNAQVTNEWTKHNGVNGRVFTDNATGASVFFPAQGYSSDMVVASGGENVSGYYWSSNEYNDEYAYSMSFNSKNAFTGNNSRTYGQAVRCVAE